MNKESKNSKDLNGSAENLTTEETNRKSNIDKMDPYAIDVGSKFADWLKALFIKFWFAGAVFYFVGWGLNIVTYNQLDVVFVLGLVMGLVTDYMANAIMRNMQKGEKNMNAFMMFPGKKWYNILLNIPYAMLLTALVAYTYSFINIWVANAKGLAEGTVALGAEPLLYGLFYLSYDMLFLGIKYLIKKLINKGRAKNKDEEKEEKEENV